MSEHLIKFWQGRTEDAYREAINAKQENQWLRQALTYALSTMECNGIHDNGDVETHDRALEMGRAALSNKKEPSEGDGFVLWHDYALLKAELTDRKAEADRLKAEVERLRIAGGESEPSFVLLSDYRHLKAENERLRASSFMTAVPVEQYESLKAEVERLRNLAIKIDGYVDLVRHENERLRKAGDAIVKDNLNWLTDKKHIADWNAAKGGKPSV